MNGIRDKKTTERFKNIMVRIRENGLGKLLGTASAIGIVGAFGLKDAKADFYVRTVPATQTWVADGNTEYRLDIIGSTTDIDVHDIKIAAANWTGLLVPQGLTFKRAELPDNFNNPSLNQNDFYFDVPMASPPGGQYNMVALSGSNRNTNDPNAGPTAVNERILGSYFWIIRDFRGMPRGF